ncbi:MAG: type II toxin-antitoxin system death-on-curing family toxin [Jiangellaceae bacterium]
MSSDVYYPTLAEAIAFNQAFIGQKGVRDVGLLQSALMRPGSSAFGQDAYPDAWTKAAALLHSIIRNHPFMDGNKRTGVNLALAFLGRNGEDVDQADPDALIDLAVAIANTPIEVPEISVRLRLALVPSP